MQCDIKNCTLPTAGVSHRDGRAAKSFAPAETVNLIQKEGISCGG